MENSMTQQTGFLNFDFRLCLQHLFEHGLVAHPRGTTTKELLNYNITLQDPRNRVITFKSRKTNAKYLLGEFLWYLSGSNDPSGILPYSKFWDNIRNAGIIEGYEKGTINSNYGYRIFGHDPEMNVPLLSNSGDDTSQFQYDRDVSQWDSVIDILARDKDSRQAIVNIHRPSDRHASNKDVPCTIALQFLIRENRLHMIVTMRSNDIILGFTNDVFQFTMLQEALMLQLRNTYPDLQLGYYFHNAASMHIYDRHFQMAEEILKETTYDMSMIEMDTFDSKTVHNLLSVEKKFQAGEDIQNSTEFLELSPYWQTLINAFYFGDDDSMHSLFNQPHDE